MPRAAVGGTCIETWPVPGNERADQIILEGYSTLNNGAARSSGSATALALAPDGRRLFFATAQGRGSPIQVAVIDVATRAITSTIPVGGATSDDPFDTNTNTLPVAIASAPDGTRAALLVSLPTMLVAFARYSRDNSFNVLRHNMRFAGVMIAGSITGALLGGLLLGIIPDLVLIPALAVVLLISAVKLARHN